MRKFTWIENVQHMKTTIQRLRFFLISLLMGLSAQVSAAETITFIHTDLYNSPVAATDINSKVIWQEDYQPFGQRLKQEPGSTGQKNWYTGKPQDPDTGLVYMGARYYNPQLGRFMSTDPVGFQEDNIHSFNRYAYANNNPYKYVDPDGESPTLPLTVGRLSFSLGRATITPAINYGIRVYTAGRYVSLGEVLYETFNESNETGNVEGDQAPQRTPKPRTNKLGPNQKAEGPHTQFKTDPKTGKVTGYTEFDAAGNPVKRFRGQGKSHGGTEPPFILEPKPGKGPGAPPKVPRLPRPNELPGGY